MFIVVGLLNGSPVWGQIDSTMQILTIKKSSAEKNILSLLDNKYPYRDVCFLSFFTIEETDYLAIGFVSSGGEFYLAMEAAFRMSPFVGYMKCGDHDCYIFGQNAFHFGFRPTRKFKRAPPHFQYVHEIHKYRYLEELPPYEKWITQEPFFHKDSYKKYYVVKNNKCLPIANVRSDEELWNALEKKFLYEKILYDYLRKEAKPFY